MSIEKVRTYFKTFGKEHDILEFEESSATVKLAAEAFTWKRTTTHTVLKRLCEKGLFKNQKGIVTSLLSRSQFYSMQSRKFVEDAFDGSLPDFIAAFTKNSKLTSEEAERIREMIDKAAESE